ncbi:MAG: NB-ARC domain-containing protein, partial [Nitrososphaera sp.]|nr:NB-ARC domain-containing protein [Nitrososphaera sp.]
MILDYKRGLTELKARIRAEYPARLVEFSTLEARLLENLSSEQQFGTNETARSDRAKMVAELNRLAFDTVGLSFNDLCIRTSPRFAHIPMPPQPYFAHPYPLQVNFTGRIAERQMLTDWLTNDERSILTLVAMGGMGKSSLSWYWLQKDVDHRALDGVLWWSFYEGEASFSKFLDEALIYVGNHTIDPTDLPSNYDKVRTLVNLLQQHHILLVLDGFERQLRAYASLEATYQYDEKAEENADIRACVDLNTSRLLRDLAASPTQAKILITTRLMVRDLEDHMGYSLAGCRKDELKSLNPNDAIEFMRQQGVNKGTNTEIIATCEQYNYHPLSLRLLSGLVACDKQKPGDIGIAPKYPVIADLNRYQHHILEVSYNSLSPELQILLSQFAAFRFDVSYNSLEILNPFPTEANFEASLEELIKRGLLLWDRERNRYDLHPIVRAYAYARLLDKQGTHTRLGNYFSSLPMPERIMNEEDLRTLVELFHHIISSGQYEDALEILKGRLRNPLMRQFLDNILYNKLLLSFFPGGVHQSPAIKEEGAKAWLFFELAGTYVYLGRPLTAVPLYRKQISIRESQNDWGNMATGLGHLAARALLPTGQLSLSYEMASKSVCISEEKLEGSHKSEYYRYFAQVCLYLGRFDEALANLNKAGQIARQKGRERALRLAEVVRVKTLLFMSSYEQALELALQTFSTFEQHALLDSVWLLGLAHIYNGNFEQAEVNLGKALLMCRKGYDISHESSILLSLARFMLLRGQTNKAKSVSNEALYISLRCENRLNQAEIYNFLAQWELEEGNITEARRHAEIAKERAWCDGP